MSTFKYPFAILLIISFASTLWFSSHLANYSSLIVDKLELDGEAQILPFYRKSLGSEERSTLLRFIDDTAAKSKQLFSERSGQQNLTHVLSTAVRNHEDVKSLTILHDQLIMHFPKNITLIVFFFDLTLQPLLLQQVPLCNSTTSFSKCWLRYIDLAEYSHYMSKNIMYQLYKPLVIRLLLLEFDIAMWLDPLTLPTTNFRRALDEVLKTANKSGAVFLPTTHGLPTSAFTHSDMFLYFGLRADSFFFYRMISSRFFVLARTNLVHLNLTTDWLSCCADPDCVWPLGARSSGCVAQQPKYKYTGCHAGEQSALNIAISRLRGDYSYVYHEKEPSTWFSSLLNWNKTTVTTTTTMSPEDALDDGEFE